LHKSQLRNYKLKKGDNKTGSKQEIRNVQQENNSRDKSEINLDPPQK
jgi:hypothetical protein